MQSKQGTISSVMEGAANVSASAKSGLDKTKAIIEEKVERMSTSDQVDKDMASLRKEEKIDLAELSKCKAYAQNAMAAAAAPAGAVTPCFTDGAEFNTTGSYNHATKEIGSTDADNLVVEDVVGSHFPVAVPVTKSQHAPKTNTTTVAGTQVTDSNPTHTGMPAPVVEPNGIATGFGTHTNTGSGTHIATD